MSEALTQYLIYAVIGLCVFLGLLYLIIKAAAKDAAREQRRLTEIQNRLLIHQLKKEGVHPATIDELIDVK